MSLCGEPLCEGLNFKDLFGRELFVDKVFWSYDGISLLCVCKDEDEKLYFFDALPPLTEWAFPAQGL